MQSKSAYMTTSAAATPPPRWPPPTISLPFHSDLSLVTARPFQCNGCNQFGGGSEHYRCEPCNYDLHVHCATAPANLQLPCGRFVLLQNQTTQNGSMFCDACGVEAVGFRYFDQELNHYLHPCCAFLPTRVVQDGRVFELCKDPSRKCGMCRERWHSPSYRSYYDDGEPVHLHIPCLVQTHNRLTTRAYRDWEASAPIMQGVLGTFHRKRDTASTALNAISLAVRVLNLDPDAIVEVAHHVKEAFD